MSGAADATIFVTRKFHERKS